MTLFGVDLSDYDRGRGPVDVAAMARDGITMLTHKGTEGTGWRHTYYGATLNAARAAGIPYLGAYVVVRTPGNGGAGSVSAQCDYFLAYVTGQTPWWKDHPAWFWQVDLEHWGYDQVAPTYGVQMVDLLRQRTGRPVVLYAPRWAYSDTIGGTAPLWSSSYGTNPAVGYRQAYAQAGGDVGAGWNRYSGRTPLVWQFGSRCTIGTQPGCDANAIRDETAWRELFPQATEDDMDPAIERSLGQFLTHPYDPRGPAVSSTSWAALALERPLRRIEAQLAGLGDMRTAVIAALADPTVVAALADALPDGVDQDIVEAALRRVLGGLDEGTAGS